VDRDLAPDLRVDDEDAGAADDHHVDLGRAAARPAAICEQVVSDAGDRGENPGGLALGTVRDLEAGSALLSVVYLAASSRAWLRWRCLNPCGFSGHRHGVAPRGICTARPFAVPERAVLIRPRRCNAAPGAPVLGHFGATAL